MSIGAIGAIGASKKSRSAAVLGNWSPVKLTSLFAWWKGDAITGLSDDDTLTTWLDSSGNGNDLTMAIEAKKPLYKVGIINGKPVVRFDGTDDNMQNLGFGLTQPEDLWIVAKILTPSTDSLIDGCPAGNKNKMRIYGPNDSTLRLYAGALGPTITVAQDAWHIYHAVFNGANSSFAYDDQAPVTGNAGTADPDGVILGAFGDATACMNVDIAEVCICTSILAPADKELMLTYLNNEYAIF